MKKPTSVVIYPGMVLRSSGMIVIPKVPKPKRRHFPQISVDKSGDKPVDNVRSVSFARVSSGMHKK